MNDIFTVAGIAIVASGAAIFLKQYKPEYAFGITLVAGIVILSLSLFVFLDFSEKLNEFISMANVNDDHYKILFKCFGICLLTKITSETCKDFGQESISSKVNLFGKISVLIVSAPLFREILSAIYSIMEMK